MSPAGPGSKATSFGSGMRLAVAGALVLVLLALRFRRAEPPASPSAGPKTLPTRLEPQAADPSESEKEVPALGSEYRREVVRPAPVVPAPAGGRETEPQATRRDSAGPENRRRDEKHTLPELFRMPADPAARPSQAAPKGPAPETESDRLATTAFAPFGRLLKCRLVGTIDSITARSEPIVALVTQPLYWNGSLIIPAGTEVYGYAKPQPVLDASGIGRLVDDGQWTLVIPDDEAPANGRELVLRARALDRREAALGSAGDAHQWGPDDGADGLIGYTLTSDDGVDLRLFAAAAATGVAQGAGAVAERQQPASGLSGALGATQVAPTVGNALAGSLSQGTTDAIGEWVSRLRQELSRRGSYVRVPAGKTFYLFVEQTIDPSAARVGARLPRPSGLVP